MSLKENNGEFLQANIEGKKSIIKVHAFNQTFTVECPVFLTIEQAEKQVWKDVSNTAQIISVTHYTDESNQITIENPNYTDYSYKFNHEQKNEDHKKENN